MRSTLNVPLYITKGVLAVICSNCFSHCIGNQKKTVTISQMFNHVQLHVHWMHLLSTRICRYTCVYNTYSTNTTLLTPRQVCKKLTNLENEIYRVCVYSNSRNDVPRMAQRYETIAAHTRRRASVLVVFVVFCVHMHSFAGLIRRTPPPTFSDTAITDRHSDTTIFQLRAHWVRISWSIGSEKSFGHVPPVGVEPSTSCVQGEHPIH